MTQYRDVNGHQHDRPSDARVNWRVSGYGIIVRDGLLLMVEPAEDADWIWSLPGGGIDLEPEEDILEGIVREVFEETGYRFQPDPESLGFAGEARFRTRRGRYLRSLLFYATGRVSDAPDPSWSRPTNEVRRVAWVDPHELKRSEVQWFHWETLSQRDLVNDLMNDSD